MHTSQSGNVAAYRHGTGGTERVGSTSNHFMATLAFPNTHAGSLDIVLAAKDTPIRRVLTDFNLTQELTQSRTVASTVLSSYSYFLGALSHSV